MPDFNNDLGGLRLNLLDDDVVTRAYLSEALRQRGAGVDESADGFEALAMIRKRAVHSQPYHAVIADLMMPEMSGFEFIESLRRRRWGQDLPVIVLSAHSESDNVIRCAAHNVQGFVVKPVDLDVMAKKILSVAPPV